MGSSLSRRGPLVSSLPEIRVHGGSCRYVHPLRRRIGDSLLRHNAGPSLSALRCQLHCCTSTPLLRCYPSGRGKRFREDCSSGGGVLSRARRVARVSGRGGPSEVVFTSERARRHALCPRRCAAIASGPRRGAMSLPTRYGGDARVGSPARRTGMVGLDLCRQSVSRKEQLPGQHPCDALRLRHDSSSCRPNQNPGVAFASDPCQLLHICRCACLGQPLLLDRRESSNGLVQCVVLHVGWAPSKANRSQSRRAPSISILRRGQSLLVGLLGSGTRSSSTATGALRWEIQAGERPSSGVRRLPTLRVP